MSVFTGLVQNNAEVIDKLWFLFDVETKDISKWNSRFAIIKTLQKLRKQPNIRIRLLMTTGCIEYWLMLHFEYLTPSMQTEPEKRAMLHKLLQKELSYEKGDYSSIAKSHSIILLPLRIEKRLFAI